jgi:hypothetical protein
LSGSPAVWSITAFAVLLVAGGCSSSASTHAPTTHVLTITIYNPTTGDPFSCTTPIPTAQQIVVRDETNRIVGAGTTQGINTTSTLRFDDARFYVVQVPRGVFSRSTTYSRDDLAARRWAITISGC